MVAVIMAGGKGTRIWSVNRNVPKPMILIAGKPILEYQINCIRENGILDIILVIGYLGRQIRDYFEDGSRFGVSIRYIEEKEALGTAGALYFLKESITEDFLLCNGDIIFDIDIRKFYLFHKQKGGIATLFTHPNDHPYDSAVIVRDKESKIVRWYHKEDSHGDSSNCVNAGLHFFSPAVLQMFTEAKKTDLDREVLRPLLNQQNVFAYVSPEYVKDMGTPDRLGQVERDVCAGIVKSKNLRERQKAFFLDRDGTLNVYKGFISHADQLELADGAAQAVRLINQSGYLAIAVTNQPVIARGDCTIEQLDEIHRRLETLLGEQGAYLDDIFYCPHHPRRGFAGEVLEYKISCDCRKPKPGLLLQAARQYHIDLRDSYMIGDSERDIQAGCNANCKACFLIEYPQKNLLHWVRHILKMPAETTDE